MPKGMPKAMKRAARASQTVAGPVLQMPLQANAAAAPTQADFNNLLTKLKNAGLMSSV